MSSSSGETESFVVFVVVLLLQMAESPSILVKIELGLALCDRWCASGEGSIRGLVGQDCEGVEN